jgi:hypothetical protein
MTSQEPRDEPPPRPPQGAPGRPKPGGQDEASGALGPPVDPYAQSARPPEGEPAQAQSDEAQSNEAQSDGSARDQPFEGVPYRPDPFEGEPYLAETPTRRDHIRTEQMRRNSEYHEAQRAQAPPYRAEAIGRFKWEAPVQTMPTDPVWPFVSRVKRQRRSDWPVLVFALVVAAIVTMGCCLAGFASFSAWNPFGS